jgi:hypothetical protein
MALGQSDIVDYPLAVLAPDQDANIDLVRQRITQDELANRLVLVRICSTSRLVAEQAVTRCTGLFKGFLLRAAESLVRVDGSQIHLDQPGLNVPEHSLQADTLAVPTGHVVARVSRDGVHCHLIELARAEATDTEAFPGKFGTSA